jgi:hypothetical protein
VDTTEQCLVHLPGYYCTKLPKACNYEWDLWLGASSGSSGPAPRGHFTTNIFFVELTSYRHGRKGAHHRRFQIWWWPLPDLPIAPPGGPPSISPTLVVAAAGPAASTPGARHRHLQLRWWPLLDLPPAPPRGLPSTSPTSVVAAAGPTASNAPGGPPSTSPTPVVAAAGPIDITPRGPAIDVSLNLLPAARIFLVTPTRGPPW